MHREVTVGRKHPSVHAGKIVVAIEYDDKSDVGGASLHITVLIDDVPGEPDDGYVARAAIEAKKLVDSMSAKIGNNEFRARAKLTPST